MRFLVHKRRHAPAVIIVALIDVLIVLLIFLMVTTTFKQQSALKLTLPESAQEQKPGANENPRFTVTIDANQTNRIYYIGDNKSPVTFDQLESRLKAEISPMTWSRIAWLAARSLDRKSLFMRPPRAGKSSALNPSVSFMLAVPVRANL